MNKNAVFKKIKLNLYRLDTASDDSLFTLFMFLGDGLYKETYYKFLEDDSESEFFGNVSGMQKQGDMVTIFLYDDLIPEAPVFIISITNLITILKKWDHLRHRQVESINLTLDNDALSMVGN